MGTVITLRAVNKNDYDANVTINDKEVKCYSKNALKTKYPDGNYCLVGETFEKNQKKKIADITLGGRDLNVSAAGANFRLFYQRKGYLEVGDHAYIVFIKSRFAFVITLGSLILGMLIAAIIACILWWKTPTIKPDYILPAEDLTATDMEDDNSKKMSSKKGGGAVSLGYSLEATVNLSSGAISILLQNPNASNKDMVATLYIQSGDNDVPIARSGLVKAGKELKSMTLNLDGVKLEKGGYSGYFILDFFEPDSGEKSLMNSRIDNVKIKAQ